MPKHKIRAEDQSTFDMECFECGIELQIPDLMEIEGETLCEQCAEEYLRESETHEPASSMDDPLSDRGARLH